MIGYTDLALPISCPFPHFVHTNIQFVMMAMNDWDLLVAISQKEFTRKGK